MGAKLASFPPGNADSTRLTLADGQRLLFDFADMGKSSGSDVQFDLEAEIKNDLRVGKREKPFRSVFYPFGWRSLFPVRRCILVRTRHFPTKRYSGEV